MGIVVEGDAEVAQSFRRGGYRGACCFAQARGTVPTEKSQAAFQLIQLCRGYL
jgi:hypothetical protein